jgi:hypothetical protein
VGMSVHLYKRLTSPSSNQKNELLASVQLSLQPGVELWDQGSLSQLSMQASKKMVEELIKAKE